MPSEVLTIDMDHEKSSITVYRSLFQGSGIHHSISGLQITHDIYINIYFMLFYDLTPDRCYSEGHTSLLENGNCYSANYTRVDHVPSVPLI